MNKSSNRATYDERLVIGVRQDVSSMNVFGSLWFDERRVIRNTAL